MAELADTEIFGELAVYGSLAFSGLVHTTGAQTGEYLHDLPAHPAGFFPVYLPVYSQGVSGDLIGTTGYMVPFYAPITGI